MRMASIRISITLVFPRPMWNHGRVLLLPRLVDLVRLFTLPVVGNAQDRVVSGCRVRDLDRFARIDSPFMILS